MGKLADRLSTKTQMMASAILDRHLADADMRLMERLDYYCKHPGAYGAGELSREAHKRLRSWEEEGAVEIWFDDIHVSKPFYELMCRALFDAYVETIDDEGDDEE